MDIIFNDPEIEKLAIHIRESLDMVPIRAIAVTSLLAADRVVIPGKGYLVAVALKEAGGVGGTLVLTDGPSAEVRYLGAQVIAANGFYAVSYTSTGLPFENELVIADSTGATTFVGQVFVRSYPKR